MHRIFMLALITALLLPGMARAIEVSANVDRTAASLDETLQLQVTLRGGEQARIDTSVITDFRIQPQGTQTSVQVSNGVVTREIIYNYLLVPLRAGKSRIPPLTVESAGREYKTKAILIKISKAPLPDSGKADVFIRTKLSKYDPYLSEHIVYTLELVRAVNIAKASISKIGFDGFIAKELDQQEKYKTRIEGRQYLVSALTYSLVPLKAGPVTIAPVELSCDVIRMRQKRQSFSSFFNGSLLRADNIENRVLTSEPLLVQVKTLPPYFGEHAFSGLVGKFSITAGSERKSLPTGDSTTISITISGSGNIMDASEPQLNLPAAFKVYKDTPTEDIHLQRSGYEGSKTFKAALVAMTSGEYRIGPIGLTYFDTEMEKYRTVTTKEIVLSVLSGSPENSPNPAATSKMPAAPVKKNKVEFTARDIFPLKEDLDTLRSKIPLSIWGYLFFLLLPGGLFLIFAIVHFSVKRELNSSELMALRARQAVRKASEKGIPADESLSCLYRALVSIVFSKAGVKGESLTYEETIEILVANGRPEQEAGQAADLLREIESTRYSDREVQSETRARLLQDTKKMLKVLSS